MRVARVQFGAAACFRTFSSSVTKVPWGKVYGFARGHQHARADRAFPPRQAKLDDAAGRRQRDRRQRGRIGWSVFGAVRHRMRTYGWGSKRRRRHIGRTRRCGKGGRLSCSVIMPPCVPVARGCGHRRADSNSLSYAPAGAGRVFWRVTHGFASLHRGLLSDAPIRGLRFRSAHLGRWSQSSTFLGVQLRKSRATSGKRHSLS